MKTAVLAVILFVALAGSLLGQTGNINNTLGTGGSFVIKDGLTTFLSLTDGNLSVNVSLTLPPTTGASVGVIYNANDRFIHNYQATGTLGYNTFLGVGAGNFTMAGSGSEASANTAVGRLSLSSLTTGSQNSAFGNQALWKNATGVYNAAFGSYALLNSTGSNNSAFGSNALLRNTSASANSAFGYNALALNTTGQGNAALGFSALTSNESGNQNSGFGTQALYGTTGSFNTAIGYNAGFNLTSGSNNICVGNNAQPSTADISNEITLGNSSIQTLRCQVITITALSDARDKKNIKDLSLGLDFLMEVQPREFNWDRREWYGDEKSDGSKMKEAPTAGFIAQELDEAQSKARAEWLNLVLKSNPEKLEATPGNLLPIMVKAIQELKNENDALKNRLSKSESVQQLLANEIQRLKSEGGRTLSQVPSKN